MAPRAHAASLRQLGRGPQRRLAGQPPAVLRRADPGLVPPRRRTASRVYDDTAAARRVDGCRSTRRPMCPTASPTTSAARPGGFVADPDIFDTWATSSLTPQIAGRWEEDDDLFDHIFPMDMRPQAHDIIRTWLFSTMTRSHHEFGCAPWKHAALSGWILDPDRKKMSKSKGNVVTPMDLFDQYGTDAVRYWAASGTPRRRHGVQRGPDEGRAASSPTSCSTSASSCCSSAPRPTTARSTTASPMRSTGRCSPSSTP